jgi:GGDEF domain-containing protein
VIPVYAELQRLLPKLKDALLAEGMSLKDFLELTGEIEKEITNTAITGALKKSAEGIGVSGEDLLREITSNPTEAAELIYLASEIRKGTGDKKALTDVLVTYIEKISGNMALESLSATDDGGVEHLKSVISHVESEILERLKLKDMGSNVIDNVAERLNDRMDKFLEKLEISFAKRQSTFGTWDLETTSLARLLEENVGDTEQLKILLQKVKDTFKDQPTGEFRLDAIKFELDDIKNETDASKEDDAKQTSLPKGIHNRKNILYFIEKEIFRAVRYQTPFSVVTFSMLKAVPQKKFAAGTITREGITYAILEILSKISRDTDVVGVLDQKKIIALMPMTIEEDAKLALRRLLKSIHSSLLKVNDIPLEVRCAGAVTPFDKEKTPVLKDYIRKAEHDIYDMVQRIKNLQTLY